MCLLTKAVNVEKVPTFGESLPDNIKSPADTLTFPEYVITLDTARDVTETTVVLAFKENAVS
jgi:hypothetical protein